MFLILKIQEKKFFSLYSKKQVFENRKQKLLPNITLVFLFWQPKLTNTPTKPHHTNVKVMVQCGRQTL